MSQPENRIGNEVPDYGAPQVQDVPVQQEPARIGPAGRLVGVLFSPGETFTDINRKPTWLVPMIIVMVITAAFMQAVNWRANPNWDRITRDQNRQQSEKSGQPMPSEDNIQDQVKVFKVIGKYLPLVIAVFVPVVYLFLAGIFALGLMVMQVQTTFKKILSVVAWSGAAIGLVSFIVSIASLMVSDEEKLSRINPLQEIEIAPTNLGAFLPSDMSAVIKALASSIDIFTIWLLILLTIGFAAIAGSRKVTTGKTGTLVFGLWAFWVLLKVARAAVFGV
ncbi:MAG: YIP1 family protein [Blastocatellia bacterium]|nr:YIP1 family protein [Blastocatellia bacterium]